MILMEQYELTMQKQHTPCTRIVYRFLLQKLERMGKDWGGEKRTWKFHRMILGGIIATFSGYDVPHANPFCKEHHFFF